MKEKDLLRKIIYAGVGLVDIVAEKIEKGVEELVRRGEASESKGKIYAENLIAKANEAKERAGKAIATKVYATKEELQKLEKKLDDIIDKLGGIDEAEEKEEIKEETENKSE